MFLATLFLLTSTNMLAEHIKTTSGVINKVKKLKVWQSVEAKLQSETSVAKCALFKATRRTNPTGLQSKPWLSED